MVKPNKKRSNQENIFAMAHHQRRALWVALDLLHLAKPPHDNGIDFILVDAMSKSLYKLDNRFETLELFLNPKEIKTATRALDIATLYLDGMTALFDTFNGDGAILARELKENESAIRNLRNHFK